MLEVHLVWIGKRNLSPTDHVREEDMRYFLNQLPPPKKLMGDFNTHSALYGGKKTCKRWKMLEQILDNFNFLCLNKKEKTYYRIHNNSSINDLEQGI